MFAEMVCLCGATFQLDVEDDFPGWFLTNRFAEAHVRCGFVTPAVRDTPEKTTKYDLKFKSKSRQLNEEE